MTSIALIPTEHQVFNEFDRFGLLLGLSRIEGEKNSEYKQRLLDVLVHPANATHQGLIYGITRELGLEIFDALTIVPVVDGNGVFLATFQLSSLTRLSVFYMKTTTKEYWQPLSIALHIQTTVTCYKT